MSSRNASLPANFMSGRKPRDMARMGFGMAILLGGMAVVAGDLVRLV